MATPSKRKFGDRLLKIALAIVLVLVLITGVLSLLAWVGTRHDDNAFADLDKAANAFPVPAGMTKAFPDTQSTDPYTVTRGWRDTRSLEAACASWGEAYRIWLTPAATQNGVAGEVDPGSSCTYRMKRDKFDTTLTVAKFGNESPQATLAVIKK